MPAWSLGGVPAAFVGVGLTGIVADAAFGGALGLAVVAGAGALQVTGAASGDRAARVLTLLLAAVPVAGLGLALWAPEWAAWTVPWPVLAAVVVVGGAATAVWATRLDRLRAGGCGPARRPRCRPPRRCSRWTAAA